MSAFYRMAYAVGFTPWERSAEVDGGRLEEFFHREETERGGPGRALDVGCGSGVHTLTLARRGWDVTGVDLVDKALSRARARLAGAGVAASVVKADATTLPADRVGGDFDLVLDLGCFHGLKPAQRAAMAAAVTARTRPTATVLMLAFGAPIGPPFMPTGASRAEVESAFADWVVVDQVKPDTSLSGMPRIVRKADPTFYRLQRRDRTRGQVTA